MIAKVGCSTPCLLYSIDNVNKFSLCSKELQSLITQNRSTAITHHRVHKTQSKFNKTPTQTNRHQNKIKKSQLLAPICESPPEVGENMHDR